jgi:uncharacterized protein YlzI (FlbEa/FlbD family)
MLIHLGIYMINTDHIECIEKLSNVYNCNLITLSSGKEINITDEELKDLVKTWRIVQFRLEGARII